MLCEIFEEDVHYENKQGLKETVEKYHVKSISVFILLEFVRFHGNSEA